MVKTAILNRGLLARISKNPGEQGLMPLGQSKLSDTKIETITKWQTDGLLEK